MSGQATDALGPKGVAAVAAVTFVLGLALVSGLELSRSADSFWLGLPHIAAALLFSGLAALAVALRERALAARLELLGRQSAQAATELKHQTGLAQGILSGLPVPFLLVDDQTAQDMVQASRAVEDLARLADDLTDIITKMQTC